SPAWVALIWLFATVLPFLALEWVAVLLGIVLTIAGLGLAVRGATIMWRHLAGTAPVLPLGLLVLVALPPMWEFASSGLETGLTFGWLGACFWAIAVLRTRPSEPGVRRSGVGRLLTPATAAVLIGLGPLVRPDMAIFSAGFIVPLLLDAEGLRRKLKLVAAAAALPLAYEVFRMGYFAMFEPNTALAKEAG